MGPRQSVQATDTNDNTDKTHKTINTHKHTASLEDRPSGTASRSTQPSRRCPSRPPSAPTDASLRRPLNTMYLKRGLLLSLAYNIVQL